MVVTAVEPGSAADEAGVRRGDVIVEVDREPVRGVEEYRKSDCRRAAKAAEYCFWCGAAKARFFWRSKPER